MGGTDVGGTSGNGTVYNSFQGGSAGLLVQAQHVTLTAPPPPPPPRRPAMLPHAPEFFVDRDDIRGRLDEIAAGLPARRSPARVVVTGAAGVGKSAVLLHWLTAHEELFPGGVFYADLSPLGPHDALDPSDVLASFFWALGVPSGEIPADLAARAAHFRSFTSGRPYAVMLDGVVTAAQAAPLVPGHPAGLVLMTSRFGLSGLRRQADGVRFLPLGVLDDAACLDLFRYPDATAAGTDEAVLRRIIRACDGVPAAVRIARARAEDPADEGYEALARRLEEGPVLEELAMPDDEQAPVRTLYDLSYRALDAPSRRALRALGLHPTADFAPELAARLAGDGTEGQRALRRLLDAHLVERADGRCRMIGLIHRYAAEQAEASGTPAERDAALRRMADWYLLRAAAVDHRISAARYRWGPLFADPALLEPVFADEQEAVRAFAADHLAATAVARLAHEAGWHDLVCQFAEALHGFHFRRKCHREWIALCELALESARATGAGGLVLARMHYELAFALLDRAGDGDLDAAAHHYERAQRAAESAGHARTASSALEGLGQIALLRGEPARASELFERALAALDGTDHPRGRALLTYHLGRALSAARRHEAAAEALRRAAALFAALPDPRTPGRTAPDDYNRAKALTRYAEARMAAGRPDEAAAGMDTVLGLFERVAAPKERADALLVQGDALAACGERDRARRAWQAAYDGYVPLGSVRAAEARRRLDEAEAADTADGAAE
ncbi:hypothetical protein ADL22_00815 [Streptomyces sp. NRRL F-4489]|uniref:tetratricopeptide repeat protein n=1 Tax=Streptomyces sp. NRRL F-4489 TaxID=1609095 RepID=UPI00074950D3|nr:tetratricopeptide repeat protein [Streptomyces sp. NRRL F-4489]KUL55467.1 hypothetical protein ADL22_00815 [Streptomyces sp. NRRL F-4489]